MGAGSQAEKELTLWLDKQTTGSKSIAFKQNPQAKAIGGTVMSDLGVEGVFVLSELAPILPIAGPQDQTRIRDVPIASLIPHSYDLC